MQKLTIAISTVGNNVPAIKFGEFCESITYLVLIQKPSDGILDALPKRDDIKGVCLNTIGLSHSRNSAILLCKTDYLYMTDDDLVFDINAILSVVNTMEKEKIAIGHTRITHLEGSLRWEGPATRILTNTDIGGAASCELFFHHPTISKLDIAYNPEFGVGSGRYPMGEENLFLNQILANNLEIHHVPIIVAHHPGPSSGNKPLTPIGLITQLKVQNTIRPRKNAWKRTLRSLLKQKHFSFKDWITVLKADITSVPPTSMHRIAHHYALKKS